MERVAEKTIFTIWKGISPLNGQNDEFALSLKR